MSANRSTANGITFNGDQTYEASTSALISSPIESPRYALPSTSLTSLCNDNDTSCLDDFKRQKIDTKIDIDDLCSNDAFEFKYNQKGRQLKTNQKIATATISNSGLK